MFQECGKWIHTLAQRAKDRCLIVMALCTGKLSSWNRFVSLSSSEYYIIQENRTSVTCSSIHIQYIWSYSVFMQVTTHVNDYKQMTDCSHFLLSKKRPNILACSFLILINNTTARLKMELMCNFHIVSQQIMNKHWKAIFRPKRVVSDYFTVL